MEEAISKISIPDTSDCHEESKVRRRNEQCWELKSQRCGRERETFESGPEEVRKPAMLLTRSEVSKPQPPGQRQLSPVFINKVYWNKDRPIHLCTVCGCFCTKMAEFSSCNRGFCAQKYWCICNLAFTENYLPLVKRRVFQAGEQTANECLMIWSCAWCAWRGWCGWSCVIMGWVGGDEVRVEVGHTLRSLLGHCKASEDSGRREWVLCRGESHLEVPGWFHELSQAGEAKLRCSLTCRVFLTPWDQLLWKGGAGCRSGQREELSWCRPVTALALSREPLSILTSILSVSELFHLVLCPGLYFPVLITGWKEVFNGSDTTLKECEHPLNGWQLRTVCWLCSQELGQWVPHWSRM